MGSTIHIDFFHTFVLFTPQCKRFNADLHTFVPHESLFNNFISDFFACTVYARPITIFHRLFAFNMRICLRDRHSIRTQLYHLRELLSVHRRFGPHPFTFYQLIDQQIRNFLHDARLDKCELFFNAIAYAMSSSIRGCFLIKISIGNVAFTNIRIRYVSAFMWMTEKCHTTQSNFSSRFPFVIILIIFVMI